MASDKDIAVTKEVRKVLLTGASGFLGANLLETLLNEGYEVVVLKRKESDFTRLKDFEGRFQVLLLHDIDEIKAFSIDAVIHTATTYGRNMPFTEVIKANVLFPTMLIEKAIQCKIPYFINTDTFFTKQLNYEYLITYIKTKSFFGEILKSFSSSIKTVNLKLEHIYGEKDSPSKFVTSVIKDLILNKPRLELTEGKQRRDFIYVTDVCNAYATVLKSLPGLNAFSEFEVGTGVSTSIREFVQLAAKLSNSTTILDFGALPTRHGEFEESKADIGKLTGLGWKQTFTMEEALVRVIKSEKDNIELLSNEQEKENT